MTYPFPMPVVPFRHKTETSAKQVDEFYEIHAEPIPRWLRALFALPRRAIAAMLKEGSDAQADAAPVQPAKDCIIQKADKNPAAETYSPGTMAVREEAFFCRPSIKTSRSNPNLPFRPSASR